MDKSGDLYIVATPIGNLSDITIRALDVLKSVDIIAAEDTRHTLKLLNHYEIKKTLISYHRHNEDIKTEELINILKEGKDIALVSDAGTPGISDPGEKIISKCIEENINIIPIPGACAFVNALICSGLDTSSFSFFGFLPLNKKNRKEKLEIIRESKNTSILYEAPHKLKSTLQDLEKILEDNRKIVLARELTKIHEEFIRTNIKELINNIENIKGEIVLLIEKNNEIENDNKYEDYSYEEHYLMYEKKGLSKKEIIKNIAKDRNLPKNDVYKLFLDK